MSAECVHRQPLQRPTLLLLVLLLPLLLPLLAPGAAQAASAGGPAMTGLRVQGNRIVNGAGQPVRLLGVNRSGSEYACAQGWGIFEGPTDAAAIQAMTSWGITAVRVPLNESCWLGINGVPAAYGGPNYQNAIRDYVARLNAAGLAVILDLHWSAPGAQRALEQQPMPNRDHSVEFWRQVATTFKGHSSVVFDLFNEPIPDNNRDTAEAWRCWRDGGTCAGLNYQAAGMQELVNAVRDTGATNVIMLGGVQYAARLSRWLEHKPNDPTGNLAAAWHVYNFSWCADQACWDGEVAPVAQRVPLVMGEMGQNDCATWFVERQMAWLDARGASYLGWTWNTWDCGGGPALITDYTGTPTTLGRAFRDHFRQLAAAPPPPPPTTPTGVLDDFESGNTSKWAGFQNANSSITPGVVSPGAVGNYAMKADYTIGAGGWGGMAYDFASTPQDWSGYAGLSFRFYGTNSGNRFRVELMDNRAAGSTTDTAERFEYRFVDNFTGWNTFSLPWSAFTRRATCDWQPAGAPSDGLTLTQVWGLNVAPLAGRGSFRLDQVQLETGAPNGGDPYTRTFPETGKTVRGGFLHYWQTHGLEFGDPGISFREALLLFGYPISEEFCETLEDGQTRVVQYFERARMEYHPANQPPYDILLGHFGRRIHPDDPPANPIPGQRYFPETGHNLGWGFRDFWERNGGLMQFGYPITEEIRETLEDGREHTVQYFERARFEWHPQNAAPYDILLGHFGRRILAEQGP